MHLVSLTAGLFLTCLVLLDAFQTIILPRRPVGRLRITRMFFRLTWGPWRLLAGAVKTRAVRDQFLSVYGPLALLVLFLLWAVLLIFGFGLFFFGLHVPFQDAMLVHASRLARLRSCLYVSGTTLFTLGLGDVLPLSHLARLLTVVEAGVGLGFVALVIGYVPVIYTAFSQREVLVAMLDARAGSPPTAAELLLRHKFEDGLSTLRDLLAEWERWSAEMLETHVSYPILCYYRSQHDNQSWLSALTTILDTCALMITMLDARETRQAQLTFAIGRHTLVDLVHVFRLEENERRLREEPATRLGDDELARFCMVMDGTGFSPCGDLSNKERLGTLRKLYEPSACALAEFLRLGLPQWVPTPAAGRKPDAWTVVEGVRTSQGTPAPLTAHVSLQSSALHLDVHDGEPK